MTLNESLLAEIRAADQEHLLAFWHELDEAAQEKFAAQLEAVDFALLAKLIPEYVLRRPAAALPQRLAPAPYFPLEPRNAAECDYYRQADRRGGELLSAGKVAVLTVAGGQGSRLGYDGPKGTYPITPVTGKSLFQYFAESLQSAMRKYNHAIDWYIMTSELNDAATRHFFAEHDYFGLAPERVRFFTQGTMPAIGYDGGLLLADKGSLALSPDGHGGTLLALRKSGMLDRMRQDGVEYLSYFQVDNPLVPVVDKRFIGLHALEGSEMSAIMLAKNDPLEKVGNFCVADGKLYVIEYSDLPEALARETDRDGRLRFIAGSPAIHVISRAFVERLTAAGRLELGWHRADKKIKCLDAAGNPVDPAAPNGVKLESFIFDALPLAGRTMILEAARRDEFAPTKNATGVDSVESCRAMLIDRDARRLEKAGVKIPRHADGTPAIHLELSPLTLWDDDDVREYVRQQHLTELVFDGAGLYLG